MGKLSDRLVKARKTSGYTQKKLSKLLGIAESTMNYWESGKRKIDADTVVRIAKITNVDPAWLLTGEGKYEYNPNVRTETENEPEAISATTEEKLRDKDEIIGLLKEKIAGLEARLAEYEGDGDGKGASKKRKKL